MALKQVTISFNTGAADDVFPVPNDCRIEFDMLPPVGQGNTATPDHQIRVDTLSSLTVASGTARKRDAEGGSPGDLAVYTLTVTDAAGTRTRTYTLPVGSRLGIERFYAPAGSTTEGASRGIVQPKPTVESIASVTVA